MEYARDVFRKYAGADVEAVLFEQYHHDMDEYINAACCGHAEGRLCKRCGKRQVAVELRQTRSADEGMTAYLKCRACHYQMRFK